MLFTAQMHLNSSREARCSFLYAGPHGVLFPVFMAAVLPPVRVLKAASKRVWLVVLNPPLAIWDSVRCHPTFPLPHLVLQPPEDNLWTIFPKSQNNTALPIGTGDAVCFS